MNKILFVFILYLLTGTVHAETLFAPERVDNLWYSWAGYDGRNIEIFCSFWNGSSWKKAEQLTEQFSGNSSPAVALDKNGNPWLVWAGWDGIKTSIFCRHFDGKNWSNITQADDVDIYSDTTPSITIDKNNTPWVIWSGSDGKDDDIYVSRWDGRKWVSPVMINTDDTTPDVMPVISADEQNNIIAAWCGFSADRYKLFYSKMSNNKWSDEKPVIKQGERFSADMPNILKNQAGRLELFWYEKSLCYKSLWEGSGWAPPETGEILLPEDFLKEQSVGAAYIGWVQNNICQSLRILFPPKKKLVTAKLTNTYAPSSLSPFEFFCSTAYAAVTDNKYIALGDSITAGCGSTRDGYPPRLERLLTERIIPSTVVNEGIPGERTFEGLERIEDVLNTYNAKYILIMEGTNDTSMNYSTETIIFNLGQMADKSINFGTTPLLATMPPREDRFDDRVKDEINPEIVKLAQEKKIISVDQYTEISAGRDVYMADYLHPNDAGYELMAEIWFAAIKNNIFYPPEPEKDDSGCGVVPPMYRRNNRNGPNGSLWISGVVILFFLFLKRKLNLDYSSA